MKILFFIFFLIMLFGAVKEAKASWAGDTDYYDQSYESYRENWQYNSRY